MTLETGDLLQSILDSLDRIDYIRPDDIPDIELYMDQVTTFMDSRLKNAARNPEVDKILTKTMINNYAKNAPHGPCRERKIQRPEPDFLCQKGRCCHQRQPATDAP